VNERTGFVPHFDRFDTWFIPFRGKNLRRAIISPKTKKGTSSIKGLNHLSFGTPSNGPIFSDPNNEKGQRSQYTWPSG
jgi:hypothetical protein